MKDFFRSLSAVIVVAICLFVIPFSCGDPNPQKPSTGEVTIKKAEEPTFSHIRVFYYGGHEYLTNYVVGGIIHSESCIDHYRK